MCIRDRYKHYEDTPINFLTQKKYNMSYSELICIINIEYKKKLVKSKCSIYIMHSSLMNYFITILKCSYKYHNSYDTEMALHN